jgi:hypothetical protein
MLRLAIRRRNRTALWHYVFLYKPVKMLSVNGWPSTATQAKITLAQAPKSKESLGLLRPRVASRFAQSKLSIRVVERNDVIDVSR